MRHLSIVFALAFAGCDDGSLPADAPSSSVPGGPAATAPAGMSQYPYLAADGGPHMLLPAEAAGAWKGVTSIASVVDPKSDYGRAGAATANAQMAVIPVGPASAMVLDDPPMSAWGKSADGMVEVYYLKSWTTTNLDALIQKATAALPTGSLTDSGQKLTLNQPDAWLLYAGDTPTSSAYGVHRVTLPAGTYRVLVGTYSAQGESVTVYRLEPAAN